MVRNSTGGIVRSIARMVLRVVFKIIKPKEYPVGVEKKISGIIKKHTLDTDVFIGIPSWTNRCVQYKKEWFSNITFLDFENHRFPAPCAYHELLTRIYGNYMQLPPKDKRVPHHEYRVYRKEKSF